MSQLRALALLVALAGCDQVFGLDRAPADAAFDADPNCHPVGHDDDHDCVPDDLDTCPGIANDQAADKDKDGVGDACDPDPTHENKLIEFVSFAEADAAQRWHASDATWAVGGDGDSLRFTGTAFGTYGVMRDTHAALPQPFTAIAHLVIEQLPDDHAQLGLLAAVTDLNTAVACSAIRPPTGLGNDFAQIFAPGGAQLNAQIAALSPGLELEIRFSYSTKNMSAECDLRESSGGGAIVKLPASDYPPDGPFAFEANGALTVRVENVAFYAR